MLRSLSLLLSQTTGPTWTGIGLCVVLASQIFPEIPVAAAIMLIGYGATQILGSAKNQNQLLIATNFVAYATLGCFTIASQSHAALHGPIGHISLLAWLDHWVAILLLVMTAKWVIRQVGTPAVRNR